MPHFPNRRAMDRIAPGLVPLVRALWNIGVRIVTRDAPDRRPSVALSPVLERPSDSLPTIHLPLFNDPALSRAAVLHAAAHVRYGDEVLVRAGLKPIQQAVVNLLEDARIEWLAMRELPGLRTFWHPYHTASAASGNTLEALLTRLASILFDPTREDPHPWICKARSMFFSDMGGTLLSIRSVQEVRHAASLLGNDLGQMRMPFNPSSHIIYPAYRDDNSHLWHPEDRAPKHVPEMDRVQIENRSESRVDRSSDERLQVGTLSSAIESEQESSSVGAGSAEADLIMNAMSLRPLCVLPEWDRLILRYRPAWCSVFEYYGRLADHSALLNLLDANAELIRRIGRGLRHSNVREDGRLIRSTEGSEFCPAGLVDAGIALREKRAVEERIFREIRHEQRRLHLTFLVDTSVSTGRPGSSVFSGQGTVLDEIRAVVAIACAVLEQAGHRCSVRGFCSNTRNLVRIQPVKADEESVLSAEVLRRLAGLTPAWSTRLGAVLRYATTEIGNSSNAHRIVLVTDGEPYDVDVHDPSYLKDDFMRAVLESTSKGVKIVSLALGGGALRNRRLATAMPVVQVDSCASLLVALGWCTRC